MASSQLLCPSARMPSIELLSCMIIACVAAELSALGKFVKRVAKKLTAMLACYLAGEVALILSPVAAIGHREMVAPMYHPLLTPVFWVRSIYMELLHASSRLRRDTRVETARPSTGLVKILCTPKAQKEGPMNATLHNKGFAYWLGAICHAQSLYVWVPAHWTPCICTVVKNRTAEFDRRMGPTPSFEGTLKGYLKGT